MVKSRYFYINITHSLHLSDDATVDETKCATERHIVTCLVPGKKVTELQVKYVPTFKN